MIVDANELVELNGFSGAKALEAHRRLLVPGPSGTPFAFELVLPYRGRATLLEAYWHGHARYLFLKNSQRDARIVDIGAGSGGLVEWMTWGEPERRDLALYAVDMQKGERFDRYVDYDILEVGPDETKFPDDRFDAAMCSHVIHYVSDLDGFAWEAARITRPGGKIYVEWPSVQTPPISRKAFEAFGIECGTLGIADEGRPVAAIDSGELSAVFARAGCRVLSAGFIENDFLFPELFRYGVVERDAEMTTYGLWLMLRFANYAIFEKVPKS